MGHFHCGLCPPVDMFFNTTRRREPMKCSFRYLLNAVHPIGQVQHGSKGHIFKGFRWHTRSYGNQLQQKQQLSIDVLELTLRTAICSDHSLFVYIVLGFRKTLEISLKRRRAPTGIWLLIPCLLCFDRRLSNDTKRCATWLYCEIINGNVWARGDFASIKSAELGEMSPFCVFTLIQKNKCVLFPPNSLWYVLLWSLQMSKSFFFPACLSTVRTCNVARLYFTFTNHRSLTFASGVS